MVNRRVIIVLSVSFICLLTVIAFLPSMFFLKGEDGWVSSREIERISFPGGNIVVREIRQSPSDKGYVSIGIEANITSKESLAAYVDSRTNVVNSLLDSIASNSSIEAIVTLKAPITPQDFASFCQTSVEKLGEYAVIFTDQKNGLQSSEVVWFPRPQEANFAANLTAIREGSKLEGIIAFECHIVAKDARSLQSDIKVLLIDPLEDQKMLEVKERYESKGFYVQVERPFFEEMWKQYVQFTQVQTTQNGQSLSLEV